MPGTRRVYVSPTYTGTNYELPPVYIAIPPLCHLARSLPSDAQSPAPTSSRANHEYKPETQMLSRATTRKPRASAFKDLKFSVG